RWTPLPSANSSYCQACSGLSPPSYHPCWAHTRMANDSIEESFAIFSFIFSFVSGSFFVYY
ncbi:hypothetical protein ACI2JA_07455, partial [Alkalihalobacillus sp. NPDC078783]